MLASPVALIFWNNKSELHGIGLLNAGHRGVTSVSVDGLMNLQHPAEINK